MRPPIKELRRKCQENCIYSQIVGKYAKFPARRYSYYLRLKLIQDILQEHGASKERLSCLDIGSADADYAGDLAMEGYEVTCLDMNLERLKEGKQNYPKLSSVNADAQKIPFCSNSFDVVIILNTLRYIPNPFQVLLETNRVLKNGGVLVLICHNKLCPNTLFDKEEALIQFLSVTSLVQILNESKFKIIQQKYLFIPPKQFPRHFLASVHKVGTILSKLGFSKIYPEIFTYAVKEER